MIHKTLLAAAITLGLSVSAWAQSTPEGLWKTIDDDGKTAKSLVRIAEKDGVYTGQIEKIFDPAKQNNVCNKCTDTRKDQPLLGLTILRNVKASSEAGLWEGGDITDPNNGKIYKVNMRLEDGGKKLNVRGYLGISLFGRTQTWERVE